MPPKGERRKQQIINTAKEMFIDKGFQSTHIGQVCEKLDIARGTVYQYFSNKKEILYAILDTVLEKVEDIFDKDDFSDFFTGNPESKAILEFVNKRISACMSVFIKEPIVIKLIFKEIVGVDTEVNDRVEQAILTIKKFIADDVKELMARGIFKKTLNSDITASMIVGGVMLVVYEFDKKNVDVLSSEVVSSISQNYLTGVLA